MKSDPSSDPDADINHILTRLAQIVARTAPKAADNVHLEQNVNVDGTQVNVDVQIWIGR